ncbi:hypothetical protein [Heliophilum fasciatum]|uniref:Uncharacterized protein n=1 Tax=Heliophilum fasciatum TaxID=35700 RepID=A0A4R2R9J2_9FIRM|nr:hypothetical protein [Heliophilum fasciatum]MCW2279439.1 hypothetical protein [Heliophilum fasciatum]TCP59902.1 hypothetical protein EDD73_14513 [Heliophilum fasciatum]
MHSSFVDYEYILKRDFEEIIKHMNTIYTEKRVDESKKILKNLHKSLWVIIIWNIEMKKKYPGIVFFRGLISNLISSLHIIIIRDAKMLNFMERNSIEIFLRFIIALTDNTKTNEKPSNMFCFLFDKYKKQNYIHDNLQKIKNIYSIVSENIHSTTYIPDQPYECLIDYNDYYSDELLNEATNKYINIIRYFNNILVNLELKTFLGIDIKRQSIIRDFMWKEDLDSLLSLINRK